MAAVRVDASAAGSDELADAAARLAGASSVLLAADAFAEQAELTVEPRPGRTLQGPLDGRSRQVPVRLRLQRDGDGCRLLRVSDGETVRLRKVRCRALSAG